MEETEVIGSRERRIAEIGSLKNAKWDLHTFIYLHSALFDRSEDIRIAALDTLMELAKKVPEPVAVFPVTLLAYHMFDVTVASGYTPHIFRFLVKLNTPEAKQIVIPFLLEKFLIKYKVRRISI